MSDNATTKVPKSQRRHWVVGVDGSDCSRHAAHWASANIGGRADELRLLTAWSISTAAAMDPASSVATNALIDALERGAQSTVDQLAQQLDVPAGVEVSRTVERGSAASCLIDATHRSDLLVVGSRGRGGFTRLLLGSTSTQCATHCNSPVAVIPSAAPIRPAASILVAFDASPNSIAALRWAIRFAAPGAVVDCISAWDPAPTDHLAGQIYVPEVCDAARERLSDSFATAVADLERPEVTVSYRFVEDRARTVLTGCAEVADLVVMGTRGHGALGAALLGSVSSWMLHHVQRPMVVVPHHDGVEPGDGEPSDSAALGG